MHACCFAAPFVRPVWKERAASFVPLLATEGARPRVDDRAFLLPGTRVVHFSQQGESKDTLSLLLTCI